MVSATEMLKRLVSIPSVEPTQTTDSACAGEARMAQYFEGVMKNLGFAVSFQEVRPGRPNVLARAGAKRAQKIWLLESHMDTVGVEGMRHAPFQPEVRGGRLYARGASDCKGAMAAAMAACARVDLKALEARGEALLYLGTMGEETGNNGAWAALDILPERLWRTVVLEPTESTIVHASKGIAAIEVDFTGRSAHGSNPEEGVNAVYAATHFIERLQRLVKEEGRRFQHPLLGGPSMNVGIIRAGIAPNVVPPQCHVEFDWRVVPPESIGGVKEELKAVLEEMKREGLCLEWALKQTQNNEPLSTPADSPLVEAMARACEGAGIVPRRTGVKWCCDASVFCPRSEETIVFGPGSIKQAHASEEYIVVEELEAASEALARLLNGGE